MAFHQRYKGWVKVRNMFRNKRFIRLRSSSQIEPLLNNYLQCTDSQFGSDYGEDLEELHKRNFDLEKKIDELVKRANDIKSRYIKIERNYADDFEVLNKKNSDLQRKIDELTEKVDDLQSSNTEIEKRKRAEMEYVDSRNAILEGEIGNLKDKIGALELKMNDTGAKDAILKSLVYIGCTIKDMRRSSSSDSTQTGILVLIFLVGFLIGMQF